MMDREKISEFASDLLCNDAAAAGRTRLINELVEMEGAVKRHLDRGVSPGEAARAQKITRAIDASKRIVDEIWNAQYN